VSVQSNNREWVLLPEPGFDEVDPDAVFEELAHAEAYANRLGYATTISPLRVKREDGSFVTGGYVFRSFSVPAISEAEYNRMIGANAIPALDPDDEAEFAAEGVSGTVQD
jgi:hypothetical protein